MQRPSDVDVPDAKRRLPERSATSAVTKPAALNANVYADAYLQAWRANPLSMARSKGGSVVTLRRWQGW